MWATRMVVFPIMTIAISLAMLSLQGCPKESQKNIKIGILSPSTGASATHGKEGLNGAEMALAEMRESSKRLLVNFIVEDTRSKPADAVSATKKLIDIDKVKIIVGWLSSTDALAVAPICERNRVLYFAVGTSTEKLSGFGNYVFRHAPLASSQAKMAAKYILENLKPRALGVLYMNDETGHGYYEEFVKSMKESGGNISRVDQYDKTATDMRTQVAKMKANGCDVLYIPCVPRTLGYILKQSVELAYAPRIVSNFGAEGQELIDIAGPSADGIIFTSFLMSPKFTNAYIVRYKKSPQMLAALSYDSLNLLFDAIRQVGANPDEIIKYFRSMDPKTGATGSIRFDDLHDAVKEVILKTIKDGHFISIEERKE